MLRNANRHWRRVRLWLPPARFNALPLDPRIASRRWQSTTEHAATRLAAESYDATQPSETSERLAPNHDASRTRLLFKGGAGMEADGDQSALEAYSSETDPEVLRTFERLSRRGELRGVQDGPMMKPARGLSPSQLLTQVLVRGNDPISTSRALLIATKNETRLPIVLLQLMLRENMVPHLDTQHLSPLLPSSEDWQKVLKVFEERGYTIEDLRHYSYILSGTSKSECIRRFLEQDSFKPLFIFTFLLRGATGVEDTEHLGELIKYCRRWYAVQRAGVRHWETSVPLLTIGLNVRAHPLRLLLETCYRLDPRLVPDVATIVSTVIRSLSQLPNSHADFVHLKQSRIFNEALCLFRQSNYGVSRRKLPSAYTWAALEILLSTSASLDRPCMTSLEGFRAIKEVMASQTRDQKDLRIIPRLSRTWPPYLLPGDGMDEATEPEENWSRTVLASAFMQENGYSKEEADLALDVLQGMAPNGTPTIHQPGTVAWPGGMRLWEASIMATRDATEAWQMFQRCPGDLHPKPTIKEYIAMFQKLINREPGPAEKALPGDRNYNFPTSAYNNLTELERIRREPPTVEQLYAKMRSEGIVLSPKCMRLLISRAPSMHEVSTYIFDSDLGDNIKMSFLSWDAWNTEDFRSNRAAKTAVKLFPIFATTMLRLTQPSANRIREIIQRGADILKLAGPSGHVYMSGFWENALGKLGRSSLRLSSDPETHLGAILHSARIIEEAGQMSLPTFVQLATILRKFTVSESAESPHLPDSLLDFYDPRHRELSPRKSFIESDEVQGAAAIDDATRKGLVTGLALAASMLKHHWSHMVITEQRTQSRIQHYSVSPLEQMANRQDPVQAEHVEPVLSALINLGEFEEAARVLEWSVTQWMDPDVVDALRYLDEDPGHHGAICLFRKLAEPMLPKETVQDLWTLISSSKSPFRWPSDEEVDHWFSSNMTDQQAQLLRVLRHVKHRSLRQGACEDPLAATIEDTKVADAAYAESLQDPGLPASARARPSNRWAAGTGSFQLAMGKC